MSGKTILEVASPVTQTAAAVKTLITYHNHGQAPAEMPAFYRLTAEMVLVKSNKGDVYYITTPRSCSCPSATYHPGKPCKHQRTYFKATPKAKEESLLSQMNSRDAREQFYSEMTKAGVV